MEEGLARTRVSAEAAAATDSDRHAIDLGAAEHERVAAPLRSQLSVLHRHRTTAHIELQECEARVATIEAQERSTAAALAAEKRRHASFLSGLFAQPPTPPHLATSVAPAARQPPASANPAALAAPPVPQPTAMGASTVPTVAAVTRSLGSTAPAPTRLLAPPADTLTARHAMQPPVPRESRDTSSPTP